MSRESLSARIRRGPDDGGALVAVIGIMVVLTILVSTIVTTSLFNVRMTTETRASVQARAAAEAGVDYVRAQIASGKCTSGTVSSPSGSPKFTVTIHPSSSGTATSSLPVGCPTSTSKSVVLLARGDAAASGVGSTGGNVRTVEALIESATSSSPTFNAAIYAGSGANVNTDLSVRGVGADVITGGNWTCSSSQQVEGNLYAVGDVTFSTGPCAVNGSVYSGGNFSCPAKAQKGSHNIGKNLYVQGTGDFRTDCAVSGDIWTGGSVLASNGIRAGGSLAVRGDLPVNDSTLTVNGSINVSGKIAGGKEANGWWYGEFMKRYPGAREGQNVGAPPSGESATSMNFPKIRQDDPLWTGFARKSWVGSINPLRNQYVSMSPCSMEWGGSQFAAPLEVKENTVFDTTGSTECGGTLTLGAGITFRLSADAVIFSDVIKINGDIKIESADGKEHSLYIMTPYPAAQTSCAASLKKSSISFSSGAWNQDSKTSVLLYSANEISIGTQNPPKIRGQVYSCQFNASTKLDLTFSKTGASGSEGTTGAPALKYLRDITG
ncbi:hypothetical protein Sked_17800 [Sanguibacter keddieii DSM 10542]|uniref:Tfp pilus assembly protein PilX n=1 Tax=Sanguibacter keddieii (strain ATCC 51767 / DSM 10542 / NCFB 3025 / ST-74) TaxID=446469 RepID=D1BGY7_SANKS|nr:pilus assembly PilX N-terminal domain-containing protein [Sanguibacter keddieii]ACZ21707.1 hypothetical protein Sked_17800 [Sanguibacter keddieii DSM 10542]